MSGNLDIEEAAYLVRHGWYMQHTKGEDIIMTRTNMCNEYIEHLAGPVLKPEIHQVLPLSYWAVEIRYGKAPTQASLSQNGK